MADSDSSTPSVPLPAVLSPKKENLTPIGSKITELNESRAELLNRIQTLKQDLQGWRSKLDTQVNTYRDELSDLKKSLNVEVEQLRTEFQELRTTLHQQQEDVTASLKNLGLQDISGDSKEAQNKHNIAESSIKETEAANANEADKDGQIFTEDKGNEAEN